MEKYKIVTTKEDLKIMDNFLMDGEKPKFNLLAVDTETNGLHIWRNVVIGISISSDASSGFYIPFLTWVSDKSNKKVNKIKKIIHQVHPEGHLECIWTHKKYNEFVNQEEYQVPDFIKEYLKKWLFDTKISLLMHNAPFDCLMIENNLGLDLSNQVICDTLLLKHVIDENTSCGLKETAILWQKELEIAVEEEANKEQLEMSKSVISNGGTYNKKARTIWRADLEIMGKYAIADTFLTYGLYNVGMDKFSQQYSEKHWQWFFIDEVMPLCREVVIPMKKRGVRIDVDYFSAMEKETAQELLDLEDKIVNYLSNSGLLDDFTKGKNAEEAVSKKKLINKIIELEGLEYPIYSVNGIQKKSLSKKAVEAAYNKDPHWLWGYILGEAELRYSKEKLNEIKASLYTEANGNKRYQFNIASDDHLRWLFCTKLNTDPKSLPQTDSATADKVIPSMTAEVLEEHFEKKYEFVKWLLLHKRLRKLHSTYMLPAVTLHHKGYLHVDMLQHGTGSGRFSCAGGFNLQTLPKIEDISKCLKCKSKNIVIAKPIKILAAIFCQDCKHVEEDIVCPSVIKEGFIAPEGMKILNADYASLEPRCFAFMSGENKLKQIYSDGLDFYSKMYIDIEDLEGRWSANPKDPNFLKKLEPQKRDGIKPVALGIPYGAKGPQVANLMGYKRKVTIRGEEIEILDVERGKEFINKYLTAYPQLHNYMLTQENKANIDGFVETLVGRRKHFKFAPVVWPLLAETGISHEEFLEIRKNDLKKLDYKGALNKINLTKLSEKLGFALFDSKKKSYRDWAFIRSLYKADLNLSKNFPIQGVAAHITNRAMLDITRKFKEKGLNAWICLQVHDEITSYASIEQLEESRLIVKESMENNIYSKKIDVPMIAEPIVADNLKEAK